MVVHPTSILIVAKSLHFSGTLLQEDSSKGSIQIRVVKSPKAIRQAH